MRNEKVITATIENYHDYGNEVLLDVIFKNGDRQEIKFDPKRFQRFLENNDYNIKGLRVEIRGAGNTIKVVSSGEKK